MSRGALKNKKIRAEDLSPGIAAGLTVGATADEALAEHPVKPVRPLEERLRHMHDTGEALRPRFHAETVDTGLIRESLGRKFVDAEVVYPEEVRQAILAGMICLKCQEPQDYAFEDRHLEGCEGVLVRGPHYMRDWQIVDCAHEMQGTKHLGPSKPMSEFLEGLETRTAKRRFIRGVLEGKQGWAEAKKMVSADPALLHGLSPQEQLALKGA